MLPWKTIFNEVNTFYIGETKAAVETYGYSNPLTAPNNIYLVIKSKRQRRLI